MAFIWKKDFTLSSAPAVMAEMVKAWDDEDAKVFVLRATDEVPDVRAFYESHFAYIGTPSALAEDVNVGDRSAQRTGKIWFEVRYDPKHPDAYRHSANAQPLHTDGSYVPDFPNATLLACVANAGVGGETTFIDGDDIVAAMELEEPELLQALQARTILHSRSGDTRDEKVIDVDHGKVFLNYNYYCVAKDIDAEGKALSERFFAYLQSSALIKEKTHGVKLSPGDAVTWKDRRVLHGRNSFQANQESERFIWKVAIDVGNFNG